MLRLESSRTGLHSNHPDRVEGDTAALVLRQFQQHRGIHYILGSDVRSLDDDLDVIGSETRDDQCTSSGVHHLQLCLPHSTSRKEWHRRSYSDEFCRLLGIDLDQITAVGERYIRRPIGADNFGLPCIEDRILNASGSRCTDHIQLGRAPLPALVRRVRLAMA